MAPECLDGLISAKGDIYSMGVVIIKIIAGPDGQTKSAEMPPQEFIDQVRNNKCGFASTLHMVNGHLDTNFT